MAQIDADTAFAAELFVRRASEIYPVSQAILFGSRARRSHRPESDADVAIVLHGQQNDFVATKLAMADIAYDVLLETGILVQPLPIWETHWLHPELHANPRLLENIAREGILL